MAEKCVSRWSFFRRSIVLTNFTRALSKLGIAGLIYLHRISDNRMANTPLKNLAMFRELCGKKIMTNVTLMTTMWTEARNDEANSREAQLKEKYFKEFLRLGAKLVKFDNSEPSAAKTLQPIVTAWRDRQDGYLSSVRLQKEVTTYGLNIEETGAARVVQAKVLDLLDKRKKLYEKLEALLGEKDDRRHRLEIDRIMNDMTRLLADLEKAQTEASHQNLPFASHLKIFFVKMRRIANPMLDLVRSSVGTASKIVTFPCRVERGFFQGGFPSLCPFSISPKYRP